MPIILADKKDCTGCTACEQVCPKQCIQMEENDEGFLYPTIDLKTCIECGLCTKTCPVLNDPEYINYPTTAYATYAKNNQIRKNSSSGGLFTLLAKEVLHQNGIVFGATFDENFNVCHIGIEKIDDLHLLRGSKYVQSELNNVFYQVKQALESGRIVLFSGVICQITGLKSFLNRDYSNLLTVDVLCHGVPSPKLWRKYIKEHEVSHQASIKNVFFRDKQYGWKNYSLKIDFLNHDKYEKIFKQDPFMQMFLKNISLRNSCYNCHFNKIDRISDITLGDCWGIEKIKPEMDDDQGISVLIVHTEKGNKYLENILSEVEIWQGEVDILLPPTSGGRFSVKAHSKREKMFELLNCGTSIQELCQLVKIPFSKKIMKLVEKFF